MAINSRFRFLTAAISCFTAATVFLLTLPAAPPVAPVADKKEVWGPHFLRISESKPVTLNEASFVIVAETAGKARKSEDIHTPIDIQLRITNLAKVDVLFPTYDTFEIRMKKADGAEINASGGRDRTTVTRAILIPPGASYSLCRKSELRWDPKKKSSAFGYWDGTGNIAVFDPLAVGKYKLRFSYAGTSRFAAASKFVGDPKNFIKGVGNVPIWAGEVETQEVLFEVLEPYTP